MHGLERTMPHWLLNLNITCTPELTDACVFRFKGVGPKTIACVLMFNMQRHEFPVDTVGGWKLCSLLLLL
jgi:endonuclease III-like uncharacterized protein